MTTPRPAPPTLAPSGPITQLIPPAIQTRYRHIHFVPVNPPGRPLYWSCYTNLTRQLLGCISAHEPWPTWVFEPQEFRSFNADTLADVIAFIRQATL